jgi:hypothetical protein
VIVLQGLSPHEKRNMKDKQDATNTTRYKTPTKAIITLSCKFFFYFINSKKYHVVFLFGFEACVPNQPEVNKEYDIFSNGIGFLSLSKCWAQAQYSNSFS